MNSAIARPIRAGAFGSLFGARPKLEEQLAIVDYLRKSARRIGKSGDWIIQEFEKEVGPGTWAKVAALKSASIE